MLRPAPAAAAAAAAPPPLPSPPPPPLSPAFLLPSPPRPYVASVLWKACILTSPKSLHHGHMLRRLPSTTLAESLFPSPTPLSLPGFTLPAECWPCAKLPSALSPLSPPLVISRSLNLHHLPPCLAYCRCQSILVIGMILKKKKIHVKYKTQPKLVPEGRHDLSGRGSAGDGSPQGRQGLPHWAITPSRIVLGMASKSQWRKGNRDPGCLGADYGGLERALQEV